ncbi:DUF3820 family protein [Parachlamydia sp. AcF125]|uniref:putative quorum-sensing-regulated virulence factor n=1 Tax=Parachlamydia sp. AcF125 TaxID=2795736 RepID=UPI001BCA2855|nr:DUF3820 family protein [Parachlamydia sp. AcF125]MBS4167759.1 DNA polymerase III PolC-type [Parachlamydia sp. AcF125]
MTLLEKATFVCIDCETTGLDPHNDRIIEVAVARFTFSQILEQFESLINPECPIPESSIQIHHITPEMVADKPSITHVIPQILDIIHSHPIVGHGVLFDIELIALAAERAGIPCSIRQNPYLDTLRLARLYGESPINSLEQLRVHFNIQFEGAHRAMSDVLVNIEVFKHLAKRYKTMNNLFQILAKPILLKCMPLGKHKGRSLKEIPLDYLKWAAHKNFDQDLLFSLRSELKRRKQGNLFLQSASPFSDL